MKNHHKIIEKYFCEEKYRELVDYWTSHNYILSSTSIIDRDIIEALSGSYLELEEFQKAKSMIDLYIEGIEHFKYTDDEEKIDDINMFLTMEIELSRNLDKRFDQYKAINSKLDIADDSELRESKNEIELWVYQRFQRILIIIIISLIVLNFLPFHLLNIFIFEDIIFNLIIRFLIGISLIFLLVPKPLKGLIFRYMNKLKHPLTELITK